MKLDPTSLQLFVSVVEERTIAAAGEKEHIAPAAISKRIADLEELLGSELLRRSNKGVEPTPAGAALVNIARRILHDLDDAYDQIREYASGVRGTVRVFANISSITQFLPEAFTVFMREHPTVRLELQEHNSSTIIQAITENVADVGFFTAGVHSADLETFPYRQDELVVVVPKAHPLTAAKSVSFSDTLKFPFVGLRSGSVINMQLVKAAADRGRTINIPVQVTGYDALCLMVAAGIGIGILPADCAKLYVPSLGLCLLKLNEPWAERQLLIGVRRLDALAPAARLFVNHILAGSMASRNRANPR
jgi:DNA-binding transcriptional LysR family regulator